MRAVLQRVNRAEVRVGNRSVGKIDHGLLILIAVGKGDTPETAKRVAEKIVSLRIFSDAEGRMNRDLREAGGEALAVSEFTLYGDCRKGRRPSYAQAAAPEDARAIYEVFVDSFRELGVTVKTGEFRAMMDVELVNDGPVTLLLDSDHFFRT